MPTTKEMKIEARRLNIPKYYQMTTSQLETDFADNETISEVVKEIKQIYTCQNNKYKYNCRECGGRKICEHKKQRQQCRDCNSSSFCEHNRYKYHCRDCNSSSFCEHNRFKYRCRDCDGSKFCQHDRQKHECKECYIEKYSNWHENYF